MPDRSAYSEMLFDEVLTKATPYLIFAPREFAARLAALMAGLWQTYEDDKGGLQFVESVEAIKKMLDAPEETWDPGVAMRIHSFNRERTSLTFRVRAAEKRLDTLVAMIEKPRSIRVSVPVPVMVKSRTHTARPQEPFKYDTEIKRFTDLLLAENVSPQSAGRYVLQAKKILNTYGTNIPDAKAIEREIQENQLKKTAGYELRKAAKIMRVVVQNLEASP